MTTEPDCDVRLSSAGQRDPGYVETRSRFSWVPVPGSGFGPVVPVSAAFSAPPAGTRDSAAPTTPPAAAAPPSGGLWNSSSTSATQQPTQNNTTTTHQHTKNSTAHPKRVLTQVTHIFYLINRHFFTNWHTSPNAWWDCFINIPFLKNVSSCGVDGWMMDGWMMDDGWWMDDG